MSKSVVRVFFSGCIIIDPRLYAPFLCRMVRFLLKKTASVWRKINSTSRIMLQKMPRTSIDKNTSFKACKGFIYKLSRSFESFFSKFGSSFILLKSYPVNKWIKITRKNLLNMSNQVSRNNFTINSENVDNKPEISNGSNSYFIWRRKYHRTNSTEIKMIFVFNDILS